MRIQKFLKQQVNRVATGLLLLALLSSCSNESAPPVISLSQTTITTDWDAVSIPVSVATNVDWEAQSNQPWCRLSIYNGRLSQDINILVDESNEKVKRTAIITFTTKGANKATTAVIVSQEGESVWHNN